MSQTPQVNDTNHSYDDMESAVKAARHAIDHHTDRLRPYLPDLILRLFYVYGIPFTLILLTSTLGGMLVSSFIPISTTNILIFGLNIFILIQTWRWAERRWQATGLFVQYSRFSRAKRDLRDLLQRADNADLQEASILDAQVSNLSLWADTFIKNALDAGATSYESRR